MKKILCILGIIFGIVFITAAVYFYFRINAVMQVENGIMYDGFGNQYVNNKPSSPYTIFIYIFGILGLFLVSTGIDNLRK